MATGGRSPAGAYMTMSLAAAECSFSSSFSRICRLFWKTQTTGCNAAAPSVAGDVTRAGLGAGRGADLGLVELQLVVGDPPGLLGLQPLGGLLLHVVLPQPVRLHQLPEAQLAAPTPPF